MEPLSPAASAAHSEDPSPQSWLRVWRAWLKRLAYSIGRDAWQKPAEVVRALEIVPGAVVADIGAGGGYFTLRLATATGAAGKVYAVDVDPEMLEDITQQAHEHGLANIETIRSDGVDPLLPAAAIDLAFSSNAFHHIESPADYFRRLRQALKADARVAIIDSDGSGLFHKLFGHFTTRAAIEDEMRSAGYRLQAAPSIVAGQHFLIFTTER